MCDVDTLLLSVGLIPENHLADEAGIEMDPVTRGPKVDENYMTSIDGIFACGNGLHVHDLVDFVSLQAERAAEGAARYLSDGKSEAGVITLRNGSNVSYTVPKYIHKDAKINTEVFFRASKPMEKASLTVSCGDRLIRKLARRKVMPSEMDRVLITAKDLKDLDGDIVISMEENA